MTEVTIGVLALQGGFGEHLGALSTIEGVRAVPLKRRDELDSVEALILPGGESSAIGRLLRDFDMLGRMRDRIRDGLPVWGTCAGMIILARDLENDERRHLGVMDICVRRNAYGGQLDSFETEAVIPELGATPFPLVFIRAPALTRLGPSVRTLASVDGRPVACIEGAMVATSFHPELTGDTRFHRWFAGLARNVAGR
jgi:5'-phosphate synthase pdxT subunit